MQRMFKIAVITAAVSAVALGKFVSSKVADLHPVEDFRVEHLAEKSVHLGGVRPDGVHQPYPDFVKVSFSVPSLQRQFVYDMRVMNEIFDSGASVAFDHGSEGGRVERPHRITTYTSETDAEHGYATATLHDDGTASMTIFGENAQSSYQIAPVHLHEEHMEAGAYSELQSSHKMVLHTLGSLADANNELNVELVKGDKTGAAVERLVSSSSRHLLQRFPTVAERWVGCNGGSATDEFIFKLGLAVDAGYYKQASRNGANVMDNLAQLVATMNQVYRPELGIIIQLGETEVKTSTSSGERWNQDRGNFRTCALGIEGALEEFDAWRTNTRRSSTMGAWHLLTDCYPPPGTVGLAYVGSVCRAFGSNVGVNTWSGTQTWLTVAHELGHNFGADHSFELGQGRTGGIMDYGNGLVNGVYSFNKRFREADICPTIQNARRSRQSIANCFAPSSGQATPAPFTGTWQVTQWGQCSASCGLQGVRTRTVICANAAGQSVDVSNCDPTKRPLAQEACNRVTCSSVPPTASTQAPAPTGSTAAPAPTTSIGGFPVPQCTCGEWSAFSSCDAATNTRSRTRVCSPSLVCFFLGEASEETQICNPGNVPATQQVILQINRPFSSIGNLESFKTQIEAQLPALLGMPNNVVKVTGIEDAGNGSILVTFYVLARLSQDVMMPLSEAAPLAVSSNGFLSNNSKFKVVRPELVVAAAEMNPELYPLGGNVVQARAATENDFADQETGSTGSDDETGAPVSGGEQSQKDNTKLILGTGIAGGLLGAALTALIAVVIVRRQRASKARVVLLSTHASEVSRPM